MHDPRVSLPRRPEGGSQFYYWHDHVLQALEWDPSQPLTTVPTWLARKIQRAARQRFRGRSFSLVEIVRHVFVWPELFVQRPTSQPDDQRNWKFFFAPWERLCMRLRPPVAKSSGHVAELVFEALRQSGGWTWRVSPKQQLICFDPVSRATPEGTHQGPP
jgi:hypothetical protein